ncbi:plasmid maintenance system antidote protein [Pseudoflavitalea sp. X16]|nr:plasmid maintenance system antidote protein [Paraflavitalea devenefica]
MQDINLLKGIHPGIILERELKKRNIRKGLFAMSINEYPTIIGDITKGRRKMNTDLALRIEHALGIEEGFFMILQIHYDIKEIKQKQGKEHHPDLNMFRKSLFWDTDINSIDWLNQKEAVIQRVFERGNDQEKAEIMHFYGEYTVNAALSANQHNKYAQGS